MNVLGQSIGTDYAAYWGDSVEVLKGIPDNSIHFICYSPPFSSLYVYSNSDRDLGNSTTYSEFAIHYQYILKELYRVLMPGRLASVHCMNLPTSKQHHGYIGLQDFRGDIIRAHQAEQFIYHSEVCIWKDPVTAMQRTKAIGLLHKQLRKDSSLSRQGIPDYLCTFRKPGENPERVSHTAEEYPVAIWQHMASPIWMDINPSDTLQRESAREDADERHIAPLQLEVIRRAVRLWSNPGDTLLTPFMGIGSECVVANQEGRRAIGVELKESYYVQAVKNLEAVVKERDRPSLFDAIEESA